MSEKNGQTPQAGGPRPVVVRGRITKIDAEKIKDAPISGIELGVEFDSVVSNGNFLEIKFIYHAIYKEDVGRITMSGFLLFEMDEVTAKRMADKFATDKDFEPSFLESVVNNINYKCSTDAIFPAKILELTAPIVPPRIGLRRPKGAPEKRQAPAAGANASKPAEPSAAKTAEAPPPPKPAGGKPEGGFTTGPAKSPFPFPPSIPPPFKS